MVVQVPGRHSMTYTQDVSNGGKEKNIKPIKDHNHVIIPHLRALNEPKIRFKFLMKSIPLLAMTKDLDEQSERDGGGRRREETSR
jgi:hypothetical protein